MKRYLLVFMFACFFMSVSVSAAVYKGHRVFTQVCLQCHTSGHTFIAKKTIYEWKKLMDKKGKQLSKIHLKEPKAKRSWKYFQSKKYTRKTKHLKDFLVEYAKDSGNVPACD